MGPQLTIGLSAYNPGQFLEPAVQSIFAQTFQDWELIVVDDGSADGSTTLFSSIDDPRVRVIPGGPRLGLAARLNQIVRAARAPYIARMDADDMLDESRLERQLSFLRTHPEVDVVGCSLVLLDSWGEPTGLRLVSTDHASICTDPMQGIRLAHATVVGKTEWFRKHPYNEENRSCEDWELWLNSYKTSTFANLAEPLYYYREWASYSLGRYIDAKCRMTRLLWRQRADFGLFRSSAACLSQYIRMLLALPAHMSGLQRQMRRWRSKPIDTGARNHVLATETNILNSTIPEIRTTAPASMCHT